METMADTDTTPAIPPGPPPAPEPADDGDIETSAPVKAAPAAKPRPAQQRQPKRVPHAPSEAIQNEIELAEHMALRDHLEQLVPDQDVKIHIARRAPKVGPNGENVLGALETVDEIIDEDYIREHWGGGTFGITVNTLRPDGRYKIFRRLQLKIAGEPKMHGRALGAAPAVAPSTPANDPLQLRAFDTMERTSREAQQRERELERELRERASGSGMDAELLRTMTAPMVAQLAAAQETIRQLQSQVFEASNRQPPSDPVRDRLVEKMFDSEKNAIDTLRAGYENRIETQRERYEDRMDSMRAAHEKQIDRLEERHKDEIKRLEDRHARELSQGEKLGAITDGAKEIAVKQMISSLEEQIKRLERELTEKTSKIGALEAKKDQSPIEKAEEILKMQEVFGELGGGGDKEQKWYERLIEAVGSSEAAVALINRVAGGPPADPQQQQIQQVQQQQQLPPPNVPFRASDGLVYVHDGQGNFSQVMEPPRRKKKRRPEAAAGAAPAQPGEEAAPEQPEETPEPPQTPAGKPPSAQDVERGIMFMENAIKGGASPESFGATARNLLPTDVLAYVMAFEDVDQFLAQVKLTPGSPLTTVKGRQFARAVHRFLREGG